MKKIEAFIRHEALDAIHDRFGSRSIRRAVNLHRRILETPMLPD